MKIPPFRFAPPPVAWACAILAGGLGIEAQAQGDLGGFGGRQSDPGGASFVRQDPLPIFFPPNPPPLGRAIARSPGTPAGRVTTPPELTAYVSDLFYPQLGTRLVTKTLSAKLRAQLERYREAKSALQAELTGQIELLRDAEPEARLAALSALAQRQALKLLELEKSADDLRRDLINSEVNWSAMRQWHLGDSDRRGFSPGEIAQVMRGYAFYQNGLIPAQRRLLREIFLELTAASDSTANATAAQPYLFFPPEPARVLLPDDMPAEVAAKVAAYQTKKSKLKKELYDAVYAHDGQMLSWVRPNNLKALAEKQAAPLVELDALAEEIRRGLAQVAEPAAIGERSPLPASLQHRVALLITNYAALQKETGARVETIIADARGLPMQASYRFEGDGLRFVVVPSRGGRGGRGGGIGSGGPSPEALERIAAVRSQVSAVADDYGRQVVDLINETNAIRAAIGQTLGTTKAGSIDQALTAATRVATAKETHGLYRDYRVAVFQPGLSAEQRRLLFDRVVERLELPLPRAEFQPTLRAATW